MSTWGSKSLKYLLEHTENILFRRRGVSIVDAVASPPGSPYWCSEHTL